jgi:hypothetical protein
MARKNFRAVPVKKKPWARIARPPSAKPTLRAHPRLIHGFLVRLATRSTILAGSVKPAFAVASVKRERNVLPIRITSPADDATFH